jgi:hypothetical protein
MAFVNARPGALGLVVDLSYRRTRLLGATASKALGPVVVRAELAHQRGMPVLARNSAGGTASVTADNIVWLLGADFSGWQDTLLSVQVVEDRLLDRDAEFVRTGKEYLLTGSLQKRFAGDRWRLELEGIHSFELDDGLLRVSVERSFSGGLAVALSHDAFYGPAAGVFGQFAERSLLALTLSYRR